MKNPPDREAVLYAFAVEAKHDRSTLERYLRGYPELAEELIDLSSELRLNEALGQEPPGNLADPGCEAAWKEFLACQPQQASRTEEANQFARHRGQAFVALAQSLNVPRSILTAIRDGLVTPSSVPNSFVRRFAEATNSSVDSVRAFLAQSRQAPASLAFKSDEKPSHQGPTTFRELVQNTEMPDELRLLLLRECDDDELA